MDLHWQSLSSVLCCRRCWMTRHRSGPPCRASARSWRKCLRCVTPQRSRNSWSKPITRWPTCKTASLLLCLSWSTLQLWVSTDVVIFLLTCLSLPNYLFLLSAACVLLVLMDLLLSRRWKPSRVRSGGWRVTWLRSGPCYRLQRLYPAPEKKASRWDGRVKWFHLISTWCDLQDKKRPKSTNAKWWFVLKDQFFWMSLCLQTVEQKIQSMRRTVAEIQKCKPGLCLPDKAEETLTVFTVVDQLQTLLLELEKVSMHQSISQSVLEVHWTSELYWTFVFIL